MKTGEIAEPILVDRKTKKPILSDEFEIVSGPAADPAMRQRLDQIRRQRGDANRRSSAADQPTETKTRKKRTSSRR